MEIVVGTAFIRLMIFPLIENLTMQVKKKIAVNRCKTINIRLVKSKRPDKI